MPLPDIPRLKNTYPLCIHRWFRCFQIPLTIIRPITTNISPPNRRTQPNTIVRSLGTSTCHFVNSYTKFYCFQTPRMQEGAFQILQSSAPYKKPPSGPSYLGQTKQASHCNSGSSGHPFTTNSSKYCFSQSRNRYLSSWDLVPSTGYQKRKSHLRLIIYAFLFCCDVFLFSNLFS